MRIFLTVLVLIFSLQSFNKADEIKSFEVEGITIGDTLLRFYSEEQIANQSQPILYGGKKYYQWKQIFKTIENETYDYVALYYKADDKNYIIQKIAARIIFENNIDECYVLQKNIINDINEILFSASKTSLLKEKMPNFPQGNSYQTTVYYNYKDGSYVGIWCLDFSKNDTNSKDRLSLVLNTKNYSDWLSSKNKK